MPAGIAKALLVLVLAVPLLGVGCDWTENDTPLATWDSTEGRAFPSVGYGPGFLSITDHCVYKGSSPDTRILMVFPSEASWNSQTKTIEYLDRENHIVRLKDGDQIVWGGDPSSRANRSTISDHIHHAIRKESGLSPE